MNTLEVPQELIDILDRYAGKTHSRDGVVVTALAEILTRYEAMGVEILAKCRNCKHPIVPCGDHWTHMRSWQGRRCPGGLVGAEPPHGAE